MNLKRRIYILFYTQYRILEQNFQHSQKYGYRIHFPLFQINRIELTIIS